MLARKRSPPPHPPPPPRSLLVYSSLTHIASMHHPPLLFNKCNTAQIWSWCSEWPSSFPQQISCDNGIDIISCFGEKSDQIKIVPQSMLSVILLCFVINVLNNTTIIPFNLAESDLIFANSAHGLIS